ncbi:MAG: mandelate racemase [Alphaproteobacteria bacterium]|nr:mandelate racemase [Alphaproteobacteria bacterium]
MRIVDIRQRTFPLNVAIANAAISFDDMTASVVAVVTDVVRNGKPVVGYGFDSVGRYGHGGLLAERFAPRVLAAEPGSLLDGSGRNLDPDKVWAAAMRNEKPAGHGERSGAVGLLDTAVWDAVAKIEDRPLWRVLHQRYGRGPAPTAVPVYGSGGHYRPDGNVASLADEVRAMLGLGYVRVKIKAGGAPLAEDRRRIEAVLKVLPRPDRLALDLNGALAPAVAEAFLDAVAPYGLGWVEEPAPPLDFVTSARLAERYPHPLATGENLFAADEARNLLRYGGLRPDRDLLQFDIALAYGIAEYRRIVAVVEAAGWSRTRLYPHAGHAFALHVVGGLGLGCAEAGADQSKLFGGFPAGVTIADGRASLPDTPGIGFERKANLFAVAAGLVDG